MERKIHRKNMQKLEEKMTNCDASHSPTLSPRWSFFLYLQIPLVTATNMNWNFHSLYQGYGMQASWEENYFWAMWTVSTTIKFTNRRGKRTMHAHCADDSDSHTCSFNTFFISYDHVTLVMLRSLLCSLLRSPVNSHVTIVCQSRSVMNHARTNCL